SQAIRLRISTCKYQIYGIPPRSIQSQKQPLPGPTIGQIMDMATIINTARIISITSMTSTTNTMDHTSPVRNTIHLLVVPQVRVAPTTHRPLRQALVALTTHRPLRQVPVALTTHRPLGQVPVALTIHRPLLQVPVALTIHLPALWHPALRTRPLRLIAPARRPLA